MSIEFVMVQVHLSALQIILHEITVAVARPCNQLAVLVSHLTDVALSIRNFLEHLLNFD
jgi:hypothetical protein